MEVPLGDSYIFCFTTRGFSDGVPITLASGALSVKEEANDTIITAGVSIDLNTGATPVTGLHEGTVVATGANGYEVGKYYSVYISTGTVGGVSAVGEVVGHFRIMPAEDAAAGVRDVNVTHAADTAWASGAITAASIATAAITAAKITALSGTQWTNLGSAATNYSATRGLTGTALPAVAAGSSGGVPVIGTGANTFKSDASANVTFANTSIATVTTATNVTTVNGLAAGVITAASIAASGLNGKGDWNVGKTGYALTTADWNVGKTGYTLTPTTGLGAQTADITGTITTATNVTTVNGLAANVITAAAIADAAIDNATFAADVGTTAYATNNIALAANKGADNVLNVTTFAEPGQGTPAATTTLAQKIGYLYKALINRTTSSTTEIKMYDNAGTVVDQKLTHSDNGTTYDRGGFGTGP